MSDTTVYASVQDRVVAGAQLLDEIDPRWVDEISLEQLSLGDGCQCILGQLFSSFVHAPLELLADDAPVRHGWMAPSDYAGSRDWSAIAAEYDEFDATWQSFICERRRSVVR